MSNPDNRSREQCFGTLFTPIKVGNLTLKNRVVALPTQSGLSSNHRVSSKLRGLYTARARGGAGLVMVEPGSVEFVNTESNVGIYDDRFVGGSGVGLETADLLSEQGAAVTVVELERHVGRELSSTVRWHLLRRLTEKKVRILTLAEVKRIGKGEVALASAKGDQTLGGFDSIILAAGAGARNELASEVRKKVAEVYVIGDALAPRQGADALREGNRIGRQI